MKIDADKGREAENDAWLERCLAVSRLGDGSHKYTNDRIGIYLDTK